MLFSDVICDDGAGNDEESEFGFLGAAFRNVVDVDEAVKEVWVGSIFVLFVHLPGGFECAEES